jgi:hypothetical protein
VYGTAQSFNNGVSAGAFYSAYGTLSAAFAFGENPAGESTSGCVSGDCTTPLGPEFRVDAASLTPQEAAANNSRLGRLLPLGEPAVSNREFDLPAGRLQFEFDLFAVSSLPEVDRLGGNSALLRIDALIIGPDQEVIGDFGIPTGIPPNFRVPTTRGGMSVSARGTFSVPPGSSINIGIQNFGNRAVDVLPLVRSLR